MRPRWRRKHTAGASPNRKPGRAGKVDGAAIRQLRRGTLDGTTCNGSGAKNPVAKRSEANGQLAAGRFPNKSSRKVPLGAKQVLLSVLLADSRFRLFPHGRLPLVASPSHSFSFSPCNQQTSFLF